MLPRLRKTSIACLTAVMLVFSSCAQYENEAFYQKPLPALVKNLPEDNREAELERRILSVVPLGAKVEALEAFLQQNEFVLHTEPVRTFGAGDTKEAYYQTMRTVSFFRFWSCPYVYYVKYEYGRNQTVKNLDVTFGGYC